MQIFICKALQENVHTHLKHDLILWFLNADSHPWTNQAVGDMHLKSAATYLKVQLASYIVEEET